MSLENWLGERGLAVAADTADINVFCLAEMSSRADLRARLQFHDVPARLLWKLDANSVLAQHAPCLFQCPPDSDFDRWLSSGLDGAALSILYTRLDLDGICAHLRRFTKLQNRDGRFLVRLGDPGSLRLYLDAIAHTPETVARLFGHDGIQRFYLHDPRAELSWRVQALFEQGWNHPGREGYLLWDEPTLVKVTA